MCCKLLRIETLDKPQSQWCTHCDIGVGCKIYQERPTECQDFNCGYLTQARIGEHWRPANSKMVIAFATIGKIMTVIVDPDRPDAWRKEPYYSDIKNWARAGAKKQGHICVSQGHEMIIVTPGGEINLGQVKDDQMVFALQKRGSKGTEFEYVIVNLNDPVVDAMTIQIDSDAAKNASPDERAEANRQVDAWLAQQDK